MPGPALISAALVILAAVLALIPVFLVDVTRAASGRILAFVALFILPSLALTRGFNEHMEKAKTTTFCLSCHVMEPYGRSLSIDDQSFVPAMHFQNHLVPQDQACFTCHTTYTMFGDYKAKLRGVRHLYVQYLGTVPKPADIKLYTPYDNRECLHCHGGMRKFEEATAHERTPDMVARIESNQLSCASSNCHEFIHDIANVQDDALWKPKRQP